MAWSYKMKDAKNPVINEKKKIKKQKLDPIKRNIERKEEWHKIE